jgi:ring-1,2-phenylacetyl-CoA epoxidase subunit PaaB
MPDTQWPEYMVFQQDKPGRAHYYAGGVHAPDAEVALLNARDVFVRRPECISLWVVRRELIFGMTGEELSLDPQWFSRIEIPDGPTEPYAVFQKHGPRGVHEYTGTVEGRSSRDALRAALTAYANEDVTVWWVAPEEAIRQSTPDDIAALFAIAETKFYRDEGQYRTREALREIKAMRDKEQSSHGD